MRWADERAPGHVFIVGCARTGSTLLRHILNRSQRIAIAPETHYMARSRRLGLARMLARAETPAAVRSVVDRLFRPDRPDATGYWAWLRRNVAPQEVAERLGAVGRSERDLFGLLMDIYAERTHASGDLVYLGEKTPAHLRSVPTLIEWFPQARIIHTFRDPRAIYASELLLRRQGRWGLKARLRRAPSRIIDPLLVPLELGRTLWRWREAARLDARYRHELGDRYRLIRFEDLVTDPEGQLRALAGFLDIPFEPQLLDVDVVGSSFAEQRHSGRGFDAATVDRWRDHVHPAASEWFRRLARRPLIAYGYEPGG
jgi:omega-hydroxy-beta-dihydromenaquinone-9 sulfotransferase